MAYQPHSGNLNTLKWKEIPFRSGASTIHFRYSSNGAASVRCLIGDTMTQSVSLAATGGAWEEAEITVYSRDARGTFIALGNAKTSVFLALLRKVILLIPLIYILPYFLADKVFAVFLAEPVADFIAVSTTATLFYRQYKKL